MMTRVLLLILFCQSTCAQEIPLISLKIKGDTLKCVKPCNTATASFIFTNESDNDIWVYGLKQASPIPAFNSLSGLCDITRTGTGIQFALYHPDGTQELAEFGIVDHDVRQGRVTKRMMDSIFRVMNVQFIASGMILKRRAEITIVTEVPLNQFNLKKGLYYIQFVYYCGTRSVEVLDSYGVKGPVKLFQGCATSAKIPFFVNHTRTSKWSSGAR
jgi:hypothetical protein